MFSKIKNAATSDIESKKITPLQALDNIWHSAIDATVVNTTDYVADVLQPTWQAVKNVWNIVNPKSYKRNWLKNIIKTPAWAITQSLTAVNNLSFWIASHIKNLYWKAVQDNAKHIENSTLEHIPWVWPFISKIINFWLAVPATIPATVNWIAWFIDNKLERMNNYVKLEWQEAWKIRMRN